AEGVTEGVQRLDTLNSQTTCHPNRRLLLPSPAFGGRHLPQEEGSSLGATRQGKRYETLSAIWNPGLKAGVSTAAIGEGMQTPSQ
ncbi:MAG: hypothetical protein FWD67_11670, partial [Betaproteobacteria bacterium]|nr:hypothetical protein [Betaproteobacteria bacterium]